MSTDHHRCRAGAYRSQPLARQPSYISESYLSRGLAKVGREPRGAHSAWKFSAATGLTAPTFGVVRTRRASTKTGQRLPGPPRRQAEVCPHSVDLRCDRIHDAGEKALGTPLCLDCYDHLDVAGRRDKAVSNPGP